MDEFSKNEELKRGVITFAGLAVLTAMEYFVAILEMGAVTTIFLFLIALIKAGLVLWFFMHIYRSWRDEEGHS